MSKQERLEEQEKYLVVLRKYKKELLQYPNVLYVGVGLKQVGGKITDQLSITVFVSSKKVKLAKDEIIPAELDGLKTDIREHVEKVNISKVTASDNDNSALINQLRGTQRPNRGGFQITNNIGDGKGNIEVGTLGCCVKSTENVPKRCCCCDCGDAKKRYMALTCHHVAYANNGKDGTPAYQPDLGNVIGQNHAGAKEVETGITKIDAAVILLDVQDSTTGYSDNIEDLKNKTITIQGFDAPAVGDVVRKVGRTTGKTQGKIISINPFTDGGVEYYEICIDGSNGEYVDHGDSGSVSIDEQDKVVGINYAASVDAPHYGWATDFRYAMEKLNFELISPDDAELAEIAGPAGGFDINKYPLLKKYKDELETTANGRQVVSDIENNYQEVIQLVNHNRACMVAWNRYGGPSFLRAFNDDNVGENPDASYPTEVTVIVKGNKVVVPIQTLAEQMAEVLLANGSAQLQGVITRYLGQVLTYAKCKSINDLINTINGG